MQNNLSDGRFSRKNKAWAKSIPVPENISRGINANLDYVINSHPAVLDGYIRIAREKFAELERLQEQTAEFEKKLLDKATVEVQGETRSLISGSTEPEKALNRLNRAEIEETALCYAQAQLDEMGLPLDINPISVEKTCSLEEYMENAEKYLDEKAAVQTEEKSTEIQQEPIITFYVAECSEYPILGEYHERLTLQEAAKLYQKIPTDRINGIKEIDFRLEDGSIYDGNSLY